MSEIKRTLGIGAGKLSDKERTHTLEPQPKPVPVDFLCVYCGSDKPCDLPICETRAKGGK